ncbi:MAG: tyrosine-protein phosphatase [Chloroflexota bacterium]|nr:tyrosine-protein phosphatase [Chloroflexota bacterium]
MRLHGEQSAIEPVAQQRVLNWEGCLNARDLGGYPAMNGRKTRWGAVVRSDDPSPLTEKGRQAVIDQGVHAIIDLRFPHEVAEYPNPFARRGNSLKQSDRHEIEYANISFVDPATAASQPEFTTLANNYKDMLDRCSAQVGRVMTTIARAPLGGVLIHCMGGKDRTGIISALLLELAGVPREIIADDYALTEECLRPREQEWLEHGPGTRAEREVLLARSMPRTEVMIEVLAHLDHRYGGVEPYLRGAGVTDEDISRLRGRLLE